MPGEPSTRTQGPRVVVVGAGMAGVGAVGVLRDAGISDVILLEARDRPGGRVETCVLENGFVEMGAQFLHGKNEVFNIAEREKMLVEQEPEEDSQPDTPLQFCEFLFRTSDGQPVNQAVATQNLQVLENLQLGANEALRQGRASDVNESVGQFFRAQYSTARLSMQGSEPLKTAMFRWLEYWDCQDCGGNVDELSLPGNGQYVFYPGNGTRETTSGMEAVFKVLLKESVPPGVLRLNKPVKVIQWTPDEVHPMDDLSQLIEQLPAKGKYGSNNNLVEVENLELKQKEKRVGEDSVQDEAKRTKEVAEALINGTSYEDVSKPKEESHERTNGKTNGTENLGPHFEVEEDLDVGRTKPTSGSKPDSGVKIECEDGEVFYADHVIVTSSVGFLSSRPQFFEPPLPRQHREAVACMGFGNVAKMCLFWDEDDFPHFQGCPSAEGGAASSWEECILGSEAEGMIPLWVEGADPQLRSAKYSTKMSNGRQWYEEVSIYQAVHSHQFCIVGWLGGEAAIVMESLPEEEVKDVLHELLTLFLNRPELPAPRRLIRTEWYSNPYTRGAYSFMAVGMPLEQHQVLSQPLPSTQNPVLQLAGEACSKRYYSTAHGALESGQDAAHAILRHHKMMTAPQ